MFRLAIFSLSLFAFGINAAVAGAIFDKDILPASYQQILAIEDANDYEIKIEKEGVFLSGPTKYKKEPDQLRKISINPSPTKIFTITQPPEIPYRIVQNGEAGFDVEFLNPFTKQWIYCRGWGTPCLNPTLPESLSSQIYVGLGEGMVLPINSPYVIGDDYRFKYLPNQEFMVQLNIQTQKNNEADWENISSLLKGTSPQLISNNYNRMHVRWRSEHHGNQIAVDNGTTVSILPNVWDITYSPYHIDARVVARRDKTGLPLKYELWEADEHKRTYDANILRFDQFADVDLFYIPNSIDAALPEGDPFKLPALDVPVARYQMGDTSQKPTLLYIKGGPTLTKFGEFEPTYHLLAQYFNVYVVEYRGSSPMMGEAGLIKYLNGDIGGGPVRDVVSVLRAIKGKSHPYFHAIDPTNIIVAGHSFGGFILAKIMQDYKTDIEGIKGFMFLSPLLDILSMGKFNGGRGNYLGYLSMDLLADTYSPAKEHEFSEINRLVSPAQHMDRMPHGMANTPRTLIIAPTHDGNVSVEESMKFYMEWVRRMAPGLSSSIPGELSLLDTYDTVDEAKWTFTREKSYTTRQLLDVFNRWRNTPAIQNTLNILPVKMHLIEGATHSFKDSPEIFAQYIRAIRNFAKSLY